MLVAYSARLGELAVFLGGDLPLGSLGGGVPPLAFLPPVKQRSYLPQPLPSLRPLRGRPEKNWEAWSFARNRPRRNQRSLLKQLRGETYCCWGWGGGGGVGVGSGLQDCRGRKKVFLRGQTRSLTGEIGSLYF